MLAIIAKSIALPPLVPFSIPLAFIEPTKLVVPLDVAIIDDGFETNTPVSVVNPDELAKTVLLPLIDAAVTGNISISPDKEYIPSKWALILLTAPAEVPNKLYPIIDAETVEDPLEEPTILESVINAVAADVTLNIAPIGERPPILAITVELPNM